MYSQFEEAVIHAEHPLVLARSAKNCSAASEFMPVKQMLLWMYPFDKPPTVPVFASAVTTVMHAVDDPCTVFYALKRGRERAAISVAVPQRPAHTACVVVNNGLDRTISIVQHAYNEVNDLWHGFLAMHRLQTTDTPASKARSHNA